MFVGFFVQNDIKINQYEIQQLQIPPPNTMSTKLKGGEYYNDITTPALTGNLNN